MRWGRHEESRPSRGSGFAVGGHVRLLRVVASLSWLVPMLLLAVAAWQIWQQEQHIAQARTQSTLSILAEEAEKVFESQEFALNWVDDHIQNQEWDRIENSKTLHQFLVTLEKNSNYIDSIWLFDAKGDVRATTRVFPLERRINVEDRDYFRAAERDGQGIHIGRPAPGRMTGTFAFHVARRRSTSSGSFDGVILLALSPKYFEKNFLSVASGDTSTAMLVRADGVVLSSSSGSLAGSVLPENNPYRAEAPTEAGAAKVFQSRIDGRTSIAGIQRLRRYPLYVTYAIDLSSVRGELWEHVRVFSIIAIACAAILFGASFHAVRIANNEQRALRGWQAEAEQRQRMEAQMRHALKMEALGRMAGGIAHHFNNLLPAISGLLEQTLGEIPPNSGSARRVERMIDALAQGRQLVHQILVFGRRELPGRDRLSMAAIVESALALVQASLPGNIEVEIDRGTGEDVLGDRGQLQEAVLNLLTNAIQAIGKRAGGRIVLKVEERALDDRQAQRVGLSAGAYVRVTCRDNGVGMPEEVVERAFDPFFTTKPVGQGTGLGLAITHGIIASHNGAVSIESKPGSGTTVYIYLPSAGSLSETAPQAAAA